MTLFIVATTKDGKDVTMSVDLMTDKMGIALIGCQFNDRMILEEFISQLTSFVWASVHVNVTW